MNYLENIKGNLFSFKNLGEKDRSLIEQVNQLLTQHFINYPQHLSDIQFNNKNLNC